MSHSRNFQDSAGKGRGDASYTNESLHQSFVPATQWDELRKLYPPERGSTHGLRRLTQAMEAENPENLEVVDENIRWSISPMDCSDELDMAAHAMDLAPDRMVAELDACYASEAFLDDLDWALQTYDICQRDSLEELNMDAELEILEAVQDLTRFVAKTSPRRAASAPSQPSIPD